MDFLLEILLVCLIFFLYWVFVLSKDDFILLRKNVTLEQLFNLSFLTFLVGLLCARLGYVLLHPDTRYLDPLVFFIFPYFPGLSLVGGVVGSIAFIFQRSIKRKFPFGRIFDVFSLSFFFVWPIGSLLAFVIDLIKTRDLFLSGLISIIVYLILFCVCFWLLAKNSLRDGTVGFMGFSIFFLLQFFFVFISKVSQNTFDFSIENILFAAVAIIFFILSLMLENTFFNKLKKK